MTRSWRVPCAGAALLMLGALATGVQAQQPGHRGHEHQGRGQGQEHARPAHAQPARATRQPARAQPSRADRQRMESARRNEAAQRAALDRELAAERQRAAELQRDRRTAQYRAQQQYLANLRAERERMSRERAEANRSRVLARPAYRYRRAGVYYETNAYGAQMLRRAVQLGYRQGYQAGRADRDDRVRFDYRDNYAYLDANYGFEGLYVSEPDYDYYFREGFRRGYEDGYYARYRYGSLLNGAPSILGAVLSSILGLVSLR